MIKRIKNGMCIAVKDYERITYKKGKAYSAKIFNRNEKFSFTLEDGWLYHLRNADGDEMNVQYALFDKYFEIIEN